MENQDKNSLDQMGFSPAMSLREALGPPGDPCQFRHQLCSRHKWRDPEQITITDSLKVGGETE